MKKNGGEYRNRTGVHGFAIRKESPIFQSVGVSKLPQTNREQGVNVSNANLVHEKENAGAAATASGVQSAKEVSELRDDSSASLAERHPIIVLHWGALA
ncbi:hypothetical protein [Pseudoprimorskyibacter insulae]|uniref:hypothetical protein n=1 Tax=Pseudoprimorskyibacter insulae TaxID=1695997 RepID=UPI0011B1D99E|nr:hypothetical protein [Pseudoprimorskyibacter insulae]